MPLSAGTRLGPYEILAPIGAGAMGEVWRATDTRLGRIVAIKVLNGAHSERFEQEARAIAALNHPHICTLHDVGPDYLVMEYIDGAALSGPLPLEEAFRLALQMAAALEAAHAKGITHRDLKPANILVTKEGVKLLDFGLAKVSETKEASVTQTLAGTILGTAASCVRAPGRHGLRHGGRRGDRRPMVRGRPGHRRAGAVRRPAHDHPVAGRRVGPARIAAG